MQVPLSRKRNYQLTDVFMIYLILTKNPSENQMSSLNAIYYPDKGKDTFRFSCFKSESQNV